MSEVQQIPQAIRTNHIFLGYRCGVHKLKAYNSFMCLICFSKPHVLVLYVLFYYRYRVVRFLVYPHVYILYIALTYPITDVKLKRMLLYHRV